MKNTIILLIIYSICLSVSGQEHKPSSNRPLGVNDYIADVAQGNLGYIASKFDIDKASAAVQAAKVYADPELTIGYSDNQDKLMHLGRAMDAGVSYPVNFGNARSARVSLAKSESKLAELVLQSYFQNLRADAALIYYNALKDKLLAEVQKDNLQRMSELAKADSMRFTAGTIMEIDSRQSAIEARIQKNELIKAEASWQSSLVQFARFRGITSVDTSYQPAGSLEFSVTEYSLDWLIEQAKKNRSDLQSAIQSKMVSEKMLGLVKASRATELGIETGFSYSTNATNEIAPSPQHYAFNAGLTIPLKFSNFNKGELEASKLAIKQREAACSDAELSIIAEVNQAYIHYQSQRKQLEEFHSGLLAEAEKILDNKSYSYNRGETGLLDVLNAQRTYNEIRQSFYETHYEYLASLIELERAAGIWDIE